ncbi:MAG: tRNA 2-thiocytidine(32) synthetase TtcA, partial [Gammaproteobacteria bacterium]
MSKVEKKLMHYMGKAIADYAMLQSGDRLMVCLSGGKDSFTLLKLMHKFRVRTNLDIELLSFTLDQSQPGWDDSGLRAWLTRNEIPFKILTRNTYKVVKEKIPEGKTYCSLCSRLRRGNIYQYARDHGYNKVALGHHRDDLVHSFLMSILYSGASRSMPPKLLTDDKSLILIRPLVYCQEKDIIQYAEEQRFPIIPCNLCGSQDGLMRVRVKKLVEELAKENPKVPSNILNALGNLQPSQMMDHRYWDFRGLES